MFREGGLVLGWRAGDRSFASTLRDEASTRTPTPPQPVGPALAAPRGAFIDGRLVLVGAATDEIEALPLTCVVPGGP
jgi:hypothetical protein